MHQLGCRLDELASIDLAAITQAGGMAMPMPLHLGEKINAAKSEVVRAAAAAGGAK